MLRLKELLAEKVSLERNSAPASGLPKIDIDTVSKYLLDIQRVLKSGQPENLKKLVRLCVLIIEWPLKSGRLRSPTVSRSLS